MTAAAVLFHGTEMRLLSFSAGKQTIGSVY
jgi:hypothetical protein